MAKPDHSIDPKIIDAAKQEFLRVGYADASLKSICENAGVTTGALYKRFKGKEELFSKIVEPTIEMFSELIVNETPEHIHAHSDEYLIASWNMSEDSLNGRFRTLYEFRDGVLLLAHYAHGTKYENFIHDWTKLASDCTYLYYKEMYNRKLTRTHVSKSDIHILLASFWTAVIEPFIHQYTWNQIAEYSKLVCRFMQWNALFDLA